MKTKPIPRSTPILGAALAILAAFASPASPAAPTAELFVTLPDYCNTPDGMALLPDGHRRLRAQFQRQDETAAVPPGHPRRKVETFFKLPDALSRPSPRAPNRIGPMGVVAAHPTRNLYFADIQDMGDKSQQSRLWKLVVKDGKRRQDGAGRLGFNVANGVVIRRDIIYITESVLEAESKPADQRRAALQAARRRTSRLKTPLKDDPHIIPPSRARKHQWRFGADGIDFDSKGNLYVGLVR